MKLIPIVVLDDGETWSGLGSGAGGAQIRYITEEQMKVLEEPFTELKDVGSPRAVINLDKVAESLEVK